MQIQFLKIETCISTYNTNNEKTKITGLSGRMNGVNLERIIQIRILGRVRLGYSGIRMYSGIYGAEQPEWNPGIPE